MTMIPSISRGRAAGPAPPDQGSVRCSADERLRRYGFRIVSRPAAGEPVWVRGGVETPQAVALRIVEALVRAVADGLREQPRSCR